MKPATFAILLLASVMLAACGGGGGGDLPITTGPPTDQGTNTDTGTGPETPQEPEPRKADRLQFPLPAWTCDLSLEHIAGACGIDGPVDRPHFGIRDLPNQVAADAQHMPVYHDHDGDDRRIFVGVDQGLKATDYFTVNGQVHSVVRSSGLSDLPAVGERGDIEVRHGRLSDGAGRAAVAEYLRDASTGFASIPRWQSPPEIRLVGTSTAVERQRLISAVQLVNAALPESAKLTIGTSSQARDEGIDVEFVDCYGPRHSCGGGTAASTEFGRSSNGQIEHSYIVFSRETLSYGDDRQTVILLAHELMHSLGLSHVSPAAFATIMEGTGAIHHAEQSGQPQPLSLLYSVDREALRALYGRLDIGDNPDDLGPWSANSTHLAGNGEHVNFGVALRNGYAEPWAQGYLPPADLADNRSLSGTVTWTGALLGFTPSDRAVSGEAHIGVDLNTLIGAASFVELESWDVSPGDPGKGTVWGDGDLGYSFAVRGNTFRETGGDDGRLTGVFVGRNHEGATGTLERTDLTAAFGAKRDDG